MRWVVAKGVTLYVNDDTTFFEGEEVFDWNFESIQEFKGLIAAGKIVSKEGEETPVPWNSWDFYSVDESLNKTSPNPVSNRALSLEFSRVDSAIEKERSERESADSDIRNDLKEGLSRAGSALSAEEKRAREAEGSLLEAMTSGNGALSVSFNDALEAEKTARRNAVKLEEEAREKADSELLEIIGIKQNSLSELIKEEALLRDEAVQMESSARAEAVNELSMIINASDASVKKEIEDIKKKMLVVYTLKGSKKFSDLPPLSDVEHGWVFDVVDEFVTTDDFNEGAGIHLAAGTNIVALYADDAEYAKGDDEESEEENEESSETSENAVSGEEETKPALKWDVLGGKWDTSEFYKKSDVDSLFVSEREKVVRSEEAIRDSIVSLSSALSSNIASVSASGETTAWILNRVVEGASEEFDTLKKIGDVLGDLRADIEGLKTKSPWLFNQSYF